MPTPPRVAVLLVFAAALAVAACSDDGSGSTAPDTGDATDTGAPDEPLEILVTNDDGVDAVGIDLLVEGLQELPNVEVTVYAPADDQTGAGNTTSPGRVETFETETQSGYPAVAVEGTPADSVNVAFDDGVEPDVVVSGINQGQNVSYLAEQNSGTIGAARAGASHGVPALAISQGFGEPPDYDAAVEEAVTWVGDRQAQLAEGEEAVELVSINVPTCATGSVRAIVEVPLADEVPEGLIEEIDCAGGSNAAADDVEAFMNGYATLTILSVD
jgi:5'-nucleotidase